MSIARLVNVPGIIWLPILKNILNIHNRKVTSLFSLHLFYHLKLQITDSLRNYDHIHQDYITTPVIPMTFPQKILKSCESATLIKTVVSHQFLYMTKVYGHPMTDIAPKTNIILASG